MRQKSTVSFDDAERVAIAAMKEDNGLSDADAIRVALRHTARKTTPTKKGVQDEKSI